MTRIKQKVIKICEYCGKEFEAGKTTTRCCSGYCNSRAYKDKKRKKIVDETNRFTLQKKNEQKKTSLSNRLGFSIAETAQLLGVCRQTVYNLVHSGKLNAKRISQRLTFISSKSISEFLEATTPCETLPAKERKPVTEWYTLNEIIEKYGLKYRQIRKVINSKRIPEKKNGRFTLIARKQIDIYFQQQEYFQLHTLTNNEK